MAADGLSRVHTARRRGDAVDLRRALDAMLADAGAGPAELNAAGMIALDTNHADAGEALFRRAARADPAAPQLWINVATACRRQGDGPGERDALLRVLDLDQRNLMALVRLAQYHEARDEAPMAAMRWSAVVQLGEGIADPAPQFAALIAHGRSYLARTQAVFEEVIAPGLDRARVDLAPPQRRRFDAAVGAITGRRRIYHNQCHGLHVPFLPADEFFDRDHFPWLAELEAACPAIRAEAEGLMAGGESLIPYVQLDAGTPDNKWSPLDNSLNWGVRYLWRFGERDDATCARCPATVAAMRRLPLADMPRRAPTVFFSILKGGTHLPAHTGISNARVICHLPLIVPPGCAFRVGGETRAWREGEAFVFDDTIEHEAWNDSDAPRAVLIFDLWNPHLADQERAALRGYFDTIDASGFDVGAMGRVAD